MTKNLVFQNQTALNLKLDIDALYGYMVWYVSYMLTSDLTGQERLKKLYKNGVFFNISVFPFFFHCCDIFILVFSHYFSKLTCLLTDAFYHVLSIHLS